jgi:rubrerythrin
MKEYRTSAFEILRRAMEIEREGHDFYLQAAHSTQDKEGREVFRTLAKDEKNHLDLLQRQYAALEEENKWFDLPGMKQAQADLDQPLFPKGKDAFEQAVTAKSTDLDALLFGLDIENRSYDFYRQAASEITDTVAKAVLQFLAGEERKHFDILMMRYEYLAGPVGWQA